MGLYRATLNQPEARVGQTVELDDYDRTVRKRVLYGHLVPMDEVAKLAQAEVVTVDQEDVRTQKQQVMDALIAARERNAAKEEESSIETAVTPAATTKPRTRRKD